MDPKSVVVLGMARSGTSVAAGVLQILGVHMGTHYKARHDAGRIADSIFASEPPYPDSYFEDMDFMRLIFQLFKTALPGSTNFRPPSGLQIAAAGRTLDHEIRELVRRKQSAHEVWGWKLPRTALVFSLFAPHLTNPHLVIVNRNRNDHALAFLGWNQVVTIEESFDLIDYYRFEIEKWLTMYPDFPHIMVDLWNMRDNPVEQASRLANFLDLEMTLEKRRVVADFVRPRDGIEYRVSGISRVSEHSQKVVFSLRKRGKAPRKEPR